MHPVRWGELQCYCREVCVHNVSRVLLLSRGGVSIHSVSRWVLLPWDRKFSPSSLRSWQLELGDWPVVKWELPRVFPG